MIERENNRMVSEAMLLQAAAGSIMSKEGGDHFKTMIADLRRDD